MEVRSSIKWRYGIVVTLILVGVALRLIPHAPNFAPVGAIALFGGALLEWQFAVWLPLLVMILSDLVLGLYPGVIYTWVAFLLIALWGGVFRRRHFVTRSTLGALGSSMIFFIVSNFGVWIASGMYAHTVSGLLICYTLALPFFSATLLSDVVYSTVLFGTYEVVSSIIRLHVRTEQKRKPNLL